MANQATMTFTDLPDEILQLIIVKLNHKNRLSLSLVSKSFRSLTNQFVSHLYFNADRLHLSIYFLHKLFSRFSSVSRISIRSEQNITSVLEAISTSGLKVERLEIYGEPRLPEPDVMVRLAGRFGMVKYLRIEWFSDAAEWQVAEFIGLFSSLEELNLSDSHVWSINGIDLLALNAPNLRRIDLRIDLSLNDDLRLGDLCLAALSNFANLESISSYWTHWSTAQGLCAFLRKMKNLKRLHLPYNVLSSLEDADMIADTISSSCENLSDLSMDGRFISDTFLRVIATSRFSLTSLSIWPPPLFRHTPTFTMTGLRSALRAWKGLMSLDLHLPTSGLDTQDEEMRQIVKSLPRLVTVTLRSQCALYATLFSLIQNCPLLNSMNIFSGKTREICCDVPQLMKKNYSIRRIYIHPEPRALLKTTLKSICPTANLV